MRVICPTNQREKDFDHREPRLLKLMRSVMKVPPTRGSLIRALKAISDTSLVNIVVWSRTKRQVSRM